MRGLILLVGTTMAMLWTITCAAQSVVAQPESDPRAVLVAARVLAATNPGQPIKEVLIAGNATEVSSLDRGESRIVLKASAGDMYRIAISRPTGVLTEIFGFRDGRPAANWVSEDGSIHDVPIHNRLLVGPWFCPSLILSDAIHGTGLVLAYMGPEQKFGLAVEHLRVTRSLSNPAIPLTPQLAPLSKIDIYVGAESSLPVAIAYFTHPDGDANAEIPVEVRFSEYRAFQTFRFPARIEQTINGSLQLEISVHAVTTNFGILETEFNLE